MPARRAPAAAAFAAAIALGGCDGGEGLDFLGTPFAGEARPSVGVLRGAVTVRGPEGYCVEPGLSRPATGFAVLAPCDRMAAATAGPPAFGPAALTVQIGAAGSAMVTGAEATMAGLLAAPEGRALLAAGDGPGVAEIAQAPGAVYVRMAASAEAARTGLTPPVWRAFADIDGRLATVALRAFAATPLAPAEARRLIEAAVAALRRANGDPDPGAEA